MENAKLIIGFGTLNRPKMVRDTLESLSKLELPVGYRVELVLADNDPTETTRPVAEDYKKKFNYSFTYLTEKRRGIVYMRNAILEYAETQNTSLLAFIDDDEIVSEDWLVRMVEAKEKFKADVIVGRVERKLPEDTPKWILQGKFFERPNIKTGTVRRAASTSNVLFDFKKLVVEFGLKFHPALNLSGSSDTYLFSEATEKGARIVWLNEGRIHESIPKSRMTVKWQLQRAFRHTNCRTLRKRLKHPYAHAFVTESAYGLVHFLLSFGSIPINIFRGKAGLVHIMRFFVKGIGSFAGLRGIVYKEYEEIHGH